MSTSMRAKREQQLLLFHMHTNVIPIWYSSMCFRRPRSSWLTSQRELSHAAGLLLAVPGHALVAALVALLHVEDLERRVQRGVVSAN